MVTEFARPSGLPKASTICPCRSSSESPSCRDGRFCASIFNTARSVSRSTPTTFAAIFFPAGRSRECPGAFSVGRRELYLQALSGSHHVRVGHDVAVGAQDNSGACAALPGQQAGCAAAFLFVAQRVPAGENLDDCSAGAIRQVLERRAEIVKSIEPLWVSRAGSGFRLAIRRRRGRQSPEQEVPHVLHSHHVATSARSLCYGHIASRLWLGQTQLPRMNNALDLRTKVREAYSAAALRPQDGHAFPVGRQFAASLGYPEDLLITLPPQCLEAFTGVSNVSVFADIRTGDTVLDLGCGAGLDSLVAARRTGPAGTVIGVDFSFAMLARARGAARDAGIHHVVFCQAGAEALPLRDGSIAVALVNGIFNLNPARGAIFRELARVLQPGGSVYAAELVLREPLPRTNHATKRIGSRESPELRRQAPSWMSFGRLVSRKHPCSARCATLARRIRKSWPPRFARGRLGRHHGSYEAHRPVDSHRCPCIQPAGATPPGPAGNGGTWAPLSFLLGEWIGEGGGGPGQGTGGFSFTFDLQKTIVVRKNHAEYPATKDRPAYSHSDLMIIYPQPGGGRLRGMYFDNEGHVIDYAVESSEGRSTVQFRSEASSANPGFRLTYKKTGADTLALKFEIAPPGKPEGFATYIEATARRAGPAGGSTSSAPARDRQ